MSEETNKILSYVSKLSLRKGDIIIIYQDENVDSLMKAFSSFVKKDLLKKKNISLWILPTSAKVEKFTREDFLKYKIKFNCDCGKSFWQKIREKYAI